MAIFETMRARASLSVAIVGLIGVALVLVGVTAVIAPEVAARAYGVEAAGAGAEAWVRATGVRDLAIGCWFVGMVALGVDAGLLSICVFAAALIPLGDATIVWASGRTNSAAAVALHSVSALIFVALGVCLRRGATR